MSQRRKAPANCTVENERQAKSGKREEEISVQTSNLESSYFSSQSSESSLQFHDFSNDSSSNSSSTSQQQPHYKQDSHEKKSVFEVEMSHDNDAARLQTCSILIEVGNKIRMIPLPLTFDELLDKIPPSADCKEPSFSLLGHAVYGSSKEINNEMAYKTSILSVYQNATNPSRLLIRANYTMRVEDLPATARRLSRSIWDPTSKNMKPNVLQLDLEHEKIPLTFRSSRPVPHMERFLLVQNPLSRTSFQELPESWRPIIREHLGKPHMDFSTPSPLAIPNRLCETYQFLCLWKSWMWLYAFKGAVCCEDLEQKWDLLLAVDGDSEWKSKEPWKVLAWVTHMSRLDNVVAEKYVQTTLHFRDGSIHKGKLNLVLDLDETLLTTSPKPSHQDYLKVSFESYDFEEQKERQNTIFIKVRDGAIPLMNSLSQFYDIYICSLGSRQYLDAVIRTLKTERRLRERLQNDSIKGLVSMLPMDTANRRRHLRNPNKHLAHVLPYAFCPNRMNTSVIVDDNIDVWDTKALPSVYRVSQLSSTSQGTTLPNCTKFLKKLHASFFLSLLSKITPASDIGPDWKRWCNVLEHERINVQLAQDFLKDV